MSAHEIHDGVRAAGGRVGIASVYRVLETLLEQRLVQRVDVGDGMARYEPAQADGHHHHHLVCDDCGRVQPFSDETLERALERRRESSATRWTRTRSSSAAPAATAGDELALEITVPEAAAVRVSAQRMPPAATSR